jgi:hypothetical protein
MIKILLSSMIIIGWRLVAHKAFGTGLYKKIPTLMGNYDEAIAACGLAVEYAEAITDCSAQAVHISRAIRAYTLAAASTSATSMWSSAVWA